MDQEGGRGQLQCSTPGVPWCQILLSTKSTPPHYPHHVTASHHVFDHVPYLYVMECQASVLQRGADQLSFDTLQLGSQPDFQPCDLVMDCQALGYHWMLAMLVCHCRGALFGLVWA